MWNRVKASTTARHRHARVIPTPQAKNLYLKARIESIYTSSRRIGIISTARACERASVAATAGGSVACGHCDAVGTRGQCARQIAAADRFLQALVARPDDLLSPAAAPLMVGL